jgi:hypothetical protein
VRKLVGELSFNFALRDVRREEEEEVELLGGLSPEV